MSKHNYSKYSEKKNDAPVEETVETVAEATPVVEEVDAVETTAPEIKMVEETVETVTIPETVKGIVANCAKLNVRAKPDTTSNVVCILDAASEIAINVEKSTKEWFYVCTATGIEGYCMRKFVNASL